MQGFKAIHNATSGASVAVGGEPLSIGYRPTNQGIGFGVELATVLWFGPNIRWSPGQYTFSIPTTGSNWPGYQPGTGYGSEPFLPGSRTFTAQEAQIFRDAFRVWDDLILPDFVETDDLTNPGQIRIAYVANGSGNHAYTPPMSGFTPSHLSGDIWIGAGFGDIIESNPQNFYYNLNHEISHALGINHPHESLNFNRQHDSTRYSVASYVWPNDGVRFTFAGSAASWTSNVLSVVARGPMVLDIAALQMLYGADPDTRAGDDVYTWDDRGIIFQSIYDAGGIDTFDLSSNGRGSVVDLTPGAYSSISRLTDVEDLARLYVELNPTLNLTVSQMVSMINSYGPGRMFMNRDNLGIAFSTVIENVIGSRFADTIIGNLADNVLQGGDGDDSLYGYEGDDTLTGGAGNDYLDGGLGTNTAVFSGARAAYSITWNGRVATIIGPDGTDTVTNVAWLKFADQTIAATPTGGLLINGGATDNVMTGGVLNDTFYGMAGNDTLNGGDGDDILNGGDGDDVLNGGSGVDTADYRGAGSGVSVNLATGQVLGHSGIDTLISIENVHGTAHDDTLTGDAGANVLSGGGGRDLLFGGAGNDRLIAGPPKVDAPTLIKPQTVINRDLQSAISLDGHFDLEADPEIFHSTTIPHATVHGAAHGQGYEFYSVAVKAGDRVILDIDHFTSTNLVFAAIDVLDAAGNPLGVTTTNLADRDTFGRSYEFTSSFTGVIYIRVGKPGPEVFNPRDPYPGHTYILNVSVTSQTIDPLYYTGSSLYGEDGDDFLVSGSGHDTLDGGSGFDTAVFTGARSASTISYVSGSIIVDGTNGRDVLVGIEALEFANGTYDIGSDGHVASQARVNLLGDAGANSLTGGDSNDTLRGGAGDDILRGNEGNDLLDGGSGFDTAIYSGARRQYVANSTTVSGNGEGTDSLVSIEEARFIDGVLSFDENSAYAQVVRLFDSTLNRYPDQAGMEFQANALLTGGFTLLQLTDNFIKSAEFQARFGNLSNEAFIDQLFRFTLGRQSDAAGIQAWVNVLNSGVSRAEVVMNFSESPEHRLQTASVVNAGLWIPDADALTIARLYDATFQRLPDPAGLTAWLGLLKAGAPLLQIAGTFAGSPEFQATYGALNNQQFIQQLYRSCLNREGDAAGVQAWTALLDQGVSRAQVLMNFSESPEHIGLTAHLWLGGIRFPGATGAPAADGEATGKGQDEAQVLPGAPDGDVYDPADLGLILTSKDDDAFVLPSAPDGGLTAWVDPIDDGLIPAPPTAAPQWMTDDLLAALPATKFLHEGPDPELYRESPELAWA